MPRLQKQTGPIASPFVVLVDTREQHPYEFADLVSDAAEGSRPLAVQVEPAALKSGDYSLLGVAEQIAIERKSKADLFSTLGQQRDRFVRELERLAELPYAAVVVEAEWSEVLTVPPLHSSLNPKTIYRSVIAWQQRYPAVHWWFVSGRAMGEVTTYRILERFWKEQHGSKD